VCARISDLANDRFGPTEVTKPAKLGPGSPLMSRHFKSNITRTLDVRRAEWRRAVTFNRWYRLRFCIPRVQQLGTDSTGYTHNLGSTVLSSFIDLPSASMGSRLIRSYSAITCAPTNKTKAPISTLNSTAIAVVSEP
jgi:hypothetical protein